MPLPIDAAGDWKAQAADLLRDVAYRAYDPAADAHAAPVDCVGVRGARRSEWGGGRNVPAVTWTLADLGAAPTVQSQVVDGADVWVITAVGSDPAGGTVHTCQCVAG